MKRFYDWVLGSIEWPRVLVRWCPMSQDQGQVVTTIAGSFQVSTQLLGLVRGPGGFHRRWPSIDELMTMSMSEWLNNELRSVNNES